LAIEAEFNGVVKRCAEARDAQAGEAAAPDAETDRNVSARIDDDLTMAMRLLDQWAADKPDGAISSRDCKTTSDTKTSGCRGEALDGEAEAVNMCQFEEEHANVT